MTTVVTGPRPGTIQALLPPKPTGWRFPQTGRIARLLAYGVAVVNRSLHAMPPVRAFYRRQVHRGLEISRHRIELPADRFGGENLTIAFLSDLHAGSYLLQDDLERVFARVSECDLDLAVLGGDLVNSHPRELDIVGRALGSLRTRLGIYAVPGNHEHFWGPRLEEFRAGMERFGVQTLVNRGTRIELDGASVWLCGIDEWSEGDPDVVAALDGRRAGEPTVLVSHHPDTFVAAAAGGVDLQLSGHTHGGQLCLFGWVPMRHSSLGFMRGMYRSGESRLLVGRGVGATILPIRIGARPEIPVVTLASR